MSTKIQCSDRCGAKNTSLTVLWKVRPYWEIDVLQAQSLKVWAQTWTSEQEKYYEVRTKGWREVRLDHPTTLWSMILLGLEHHGARAAVRHGLVSSSVPRVWVPTPWGFPCGGRICYSPLNKATGDIEQRQTALPYITHPHAVLRCVSIMCNIKLLSLWPWQTSGPQLPCHCITNVYPRSLSSVSASKDAPFH